MRDMTHSYVQHDMCDMTYSYVWCDSFTYYRPSTVRVCRFAVYIRHSYVPTPSYVWHDAFLVWRDLFTYSKQSAVKICRLTYMSHSCAWLDAFTYWWIASLKLQVSFAEYRLFYRALLQKRRSGFAIHMCDIIHMGWLRWVAEYRLFYRALLQKRRIFVTLFIWGSYDE